MQSSIVWCLSKGSYLRTNDIMRAATHCIFCLWQQKSGHGKSLEAGGLQVRRLCPLPFNSCLQRGLLYPLR